MVIQNYSYSVFNSHWPSCIQYSIQYPPNQNTRYSVCNSVCSLTFHWVFSMQCGIQWIVILACKLHISWAATLHSRFEEYKLMGSPFPPNRLITQFRFTQFSFVWEVCKTSCINSLSNIASFTSASKWFSPDPRNIRYPSGPRRILLTRSGKGGMLVKNWE